MHRRHAVEHAGVGRLADLHLSCHLFHQPIVLHLHKRGAIRPPGHRIFHDRLAFELLGPRLVGIVHHAHRGMVHLMALMLLRIFGKSARSGDD